jgi:hypothetical protein
MSEQKKRAKSPQKRPVDKQTLKAFWDLMSQHFPGLLIDLSLFDYKAGEFNKPKVSKEDYAKEKEVPVEKAYDTVLKLLPKYHKGKDILWKPSDYYKEHRDALVSLVWLDDFKLDKSLGHTPLLYLETSPKKYQAIFKLSEPATVDDTDTVQKAMVKILKLGDNAATSFFHHRRMPGLANGKYEDDPLVIFTVPETPSRIAIRDIETALRKEEEGVAENNAVANKGQGTNGQGQDKGQEQKERTKGFYVNPVVPVNYQSVLIEKRETDRFLKKKDDGTIDDSATDMAWATHIARMTYNAGWDDMAIGFTIYDLLVQHSPEIQRRKGSPKHVREYLFRTAWKALKEVKRTPSEPPKKKEEAPDF